MIKLIVFTDGDVTFDYNENGLQNLTDEEKQLESLFGIMSDEEALLEAKSLLPHLSESEIITILQTRVFPNAYQEIIPEFLKNITKKYPEIRIGIATEHTRYVASYLKDYVNEYYISNEIGADKTDPHFFEVIISRSGVNPSQIVYVDFDKNNIALAKACGLSVLHVTPKDLNLMVNVERAQYGHLLVDALKHLESSKRGSK